MKPKFNPNEKWFVPAVVTKDTIFMMGLSKWFTQIFPKLGLGDKLTEYISYFVGDTCDMYFKRSEFEEETDFLADKIVGQPDWTLEFISQIEDWSNKFMECSKRLSKLAFKNMSDKEIIEEYEKVFKWHDLSHGAATSVSWMADADKEKVAKAIYKVVEDQVKKRGLDLEPSVVFSILSTPNKESFPAKEEKEFLKVAKGFYDNKKVVKLFSGSTNISEIAKLLKVNYLDSYNAVFSHYERWRWLPYGYKGPAYTLNYYLNRIGSLLKEDQNPEALYQAVIQKERGVAKNQTELLEKLKFSKDQLKLLKVAQEIIYIKDYRKCALYHGMYCYEQMFKEIATRLGLQLKHIWAMNNWELQEFLLSKKAPKEELEARTKRALIYVDRNQYTVYFGKEAKELFDSLPKEKIETKNVEELKGMCACPGQAKGAVKIIEVPSDMKKMNQGDILVSETTYPSLVPAMKKAAAIVTNAGGLTCHAAIVSRELRIPCVVGTKIANKIFKDGDVIEVNATKGIVRLRSKATVDK